MNKKAIKTNDMNLLAQYRDSLYEHPRLTYLFFELTDACNLSCLHCGSSACPQNQTYLPKAAVKDVMDNVARKYSPQSIMICLTGGEPLLHPDFFDIAAYARKLGFSCGITTNGMLIDKEVAKRIKESGIQSVTFSLDGLADSHDWFRNKKGAFAKAIAGIQNLVNESKGKIITQITTVIHKKNIQELDSIYELVLNLSVDSWRIINLEPIGRALQHEDLLLDADDMRNLLEYIREKRYSRQTPIEVKYGCAHYLTTDFEREVRDNYFICGSGIYVASILCNGDIYSCMDIERRPELVQGNIGQDDFVEVWENRFQAFRKDRTEECASCHECEDRRYCRGDAAHTWDYDHNRPLMCLKKMFEEGSK